jgi:GGDEF domain-containing protein
MQNAERRMHNVDAAGAARGNGRCDATVREPAASPVLLISLLILAACQIGVLRQLPSAPGSAALVSGLLAGCIGLLVALCLILRRRRLADGRAYASPAHAREAEPWRIWKPAESRLDSCQDGASAPYEVLAHFSAWLREHEGAAPLWPALDQLLREVFTERLGASRVRCYEVLAGCEQLRPLSQRPLADWTLHVGKAATGGADATADRGGASATAGGNPSAPTGVTCSARDGIFGHVITTRTEFFAAQRSPGPLLDELAGAADERYEWVFPVERVPAPGERPAVVGLVAVGSFQGAALPGRAQRQAVARLVGLLWNYVDCRAQLRIVSQTDRATGVLTRVDFFVMAQEALRESYRHNEPSVVAVLSLEGLRGLDDHGLWQQRDALVENVARLVRGRLRTDDVVGRFSDERFVLLLRRLDSGLGRLIIEKIVGAIDDYLAGRVGGAAPAALPEALPATDPLTRIRVRAGLAGSGLREISLATLLVSAIEAADAARRLNRSVCSDIEPTAAAQPEGATGRGPQAVAAGDSGG